MKPFVFTLIPSSEDFEDVYKLGIQQTANKLGAYCDKVEEQIFQGSILDRILNQINKADVIVADTTGKNPNVFFEIGYALALKKKIIYLTQSVKDIPFDLKHHTHIEYNKVTMLQERLERVLSHYLSEENKSELDLEYGLEILINGQLLKEGEEIILKRTSYNEKLELSIHNLTSKVYNTGSIQIGLITDVPIDFFLPIRDVETIPLTEKKNMKLLTLEKKIFPNGWLSVLLYSDINPITGIISDPDYDYSAKIQIFTSYGYHDYFYRTATDETLVQSMLKDLI